MASLAGAFRAIPESIERLRSALAVDSKYQSIAKLQDAIIRMQFNVDERIQFYDDLGTNLSTGASLEEVLAKLYEIHSYEGQKPHEPMAVVVGQTLDLIKAGFPLHVAMERWISDQESVLIAAGEEAGELHTVFPRIVWALTELQNINKTLFAILGQPIILWLMSLGVFEILAYFITPQMLDLLPLDKWQGAPKYMIQAGMGVQSYQFVGLIIFAALFIAIRWAMPNYIGPYRTKLDGWPIFNIYRIRQSVTFMVGMTVMLPSGIAVERALKRLAENAKPYLSNIAETTRDCLRGGQRLGKALRDTELNFPDRKTIASLQMISDQKNFAEALERYTGRWLELRVRAISKSANIIRLVAQVIVIGVILLIAAGSMGIGPSIKAAYQ